MGIITNKITLGANDSVTTPYVDAISLSLSASSTDQQIPTAKSVYTLSKWKGGSLYDSGGSLYPTIVPKTSTDIVRLPGLIFGTAGTHLINGTVTTVSVSSTDSKIPTAKACYTAINSAVSGLASTSYVTSAISTALTPYATQTYVGDEIADAIAAIPSYAGPTTVSASVSNTGWTLTGGYYRKTVTVSGVTSSNTIIVSPRNVRSEYNEYIDKKIMLYSQSTNSVVLEATAIPLLSITINVIIF